MNDFNKLHTREDNIAQYLQLVQDMDFDAARAALASHNEADLKAMQKRLYEIAVELETQARPAINRLLYFMQMELEAKHKPVASEISGSVVKETHEYGIAPAVVKETHEYGIAPAVIKETSDYATIADLDKTVQAAEAEAAAKAGLVYHNIPKMPADHSDPIYHNLPEYPHELEQGAYHNLPKAEITEEDPIYHNINLVYSDVEVKTPAKAKTKKGLIHKSTEQLLELKDGKALLKKLGDKKKFFQRAVLILDSDQFDQLDEIFQHDIIEMVIEKSKDPIGRFVLADKIIDKIAGSDSLKFEYGAFDENRDLIWNAISEAPILKDKFVNAIRESLYRVINTTINGEPLPVISHLIEYDAKAAIASEDSVYQPIPSEEDMKGQFFGTTDLDVGCVLDGVEAANQVAKDLIGKTDRAFYEYVISGSKDDTEARATYQACFKNLENFLSEHGQKPEYQVACKEVQATIDYNQEHIDSIKSIYGDTVTTANSDAIREGLAGTKSEDAKSVSELIQIFDNE